MFFKISFSFYLFISAVCSQPIIHNNKSEQNKSIKEIIFWGPSPSETDSMIGDENEVYSDYYYYIGLAAPELKKMGIDLKDTTSFELRINYYTDSAQVFRREKGSVAYIFSDGKKKPKIIYNVMVNDEIISAAKEFFGVTGR
jgi:hypothetical protein